MSLSMHEASVPIFVRMLNNMLEWLDKAEAYAKERGFEPNNFLTLRLAPDMFDFARQIQIASDAVKGCVSRLSGSEAPSWADDEATLDELRARIQKTIEYAQSIPADQIAGSAKREITLAVPGAEMKFSGEDFLRKFALPNFFFHCSMVYALLRGAGVPIGKMDYLGSI